jgi:hypothetical protein
MKTRLTGSFLATSLLLVPLARLRAQDQLTDTEKAAAMAAVGACAAAAAHAKEHDQGPDYRESGKVVTVNIYNTAGERVPVFLYPRHGGWFGPRGEFYRAMPKLKYLTAVYGSRRPVPVTPLPPPGTRPESQLEKRQPPQGQRQTSGHAAPMPDGSLKAEAGRGKVKILSGDRTISTVRTAMPNVVDWKFADKHRQIIVKSRAKQGRAIVELFNTRTGTLQDSVLASEIPKGGDDWARGFED